MGSLSIWHLLIFLVIAVVIFGTKRLTSGAKDLGTAVKEFKKAMGEESDPHKTNPIHPAVDQVPPADITRVQRPPPANPPGNDPSPRA